jgi:hypothetical protein
MVCADTVAAVLAGAPVAGVLAWASAFGVAELLELPELLDHEASKPMPAMPTTLAIRIFKLISS